MDINRLIGSFLGNSSGAGSAGSVSGMASQLGNKLPGGHAGGAAAGGLVALMLGSKKARKMGGKALTYGGMAVVGGLAYQAYKNYKSSQQAPSQPIRSIEPAPADSGFDPAQIQDQRGQDMRLALIQAMISAAKSDGHIDATENSRIREQINAAQLAADEKAFLFDLLDGDSDPVAVARLAADEPQAAELYLASALTIDVDTPEEQRYMERLGDALRLPAELQRQLTDHASAAKAGAGEA